MDETDSSLNLVLFLLQVRTVPGGKVRSALEKHCAVHFLHSRFASQAFRAGPTGQEFWVAHLWAKKSMYEVC